jgi:hypothetical protein
MAVSALLLILLDAIIVSPSPSTARLVFALVVAVVVLLAITAIWLRNSRLERADPASSPF